MTLSADLQRDAILLASLDPLKHRLTVRKMLVLVAIVAAVFAACVNLVRSSTPETLVSSWTDSKGGFVEVGLADTAYSHLLISQRSFEDIQLTRRDYLAFPKYTRTTLFVDGEPVKLGIKPLVIFIDGEGEVHTAACPVEFDEVLRLANSLSNLTWRERGDVMPATSKWLETHRDLQWPSALRQALLGQ